MYCVWNVRGAVKKLFVRHVLDMKNIYKFHVFVIVEPKISGLKARKIINRIGFYDCFVVKAEGFVGGIRMLWDNNKVKLKDIASSKQSITTLVEDDNGCWVLTTVSGSPNVSIRKALVLGRLFGITCLLLEIALRGLGW
ncbi:hypothetical protein ACOSP7_006934 [Xanthoceras sorbifolium]